MRIACSWSPGSCWECERRSLPHPRCTGTGQAGVHREDLQSIIVERSNRLSGTSRATNWQASQGKKHLLHGRRKISGFCAEIQIESFRFEAQLGDTVLFHYVCVQMDTLLGKPDEVRGNYSWWTTIESWGRSNSSSPWMPLKRRLFRQLWNLDSVADVVPCLMKETLISFLFLPPESCSNFLFLLRVAKLMSIQWPKWFWMISNVGSCHTLLHHQIR